MAETGKRIKSLLNDDVRPVVAQIAECLADWYKHAQTIYVKVGAISFNIKTLWSIIYYMFADSVPGERHEEL